jgi:predicted MFS family arabinose efflux permease
MIRCHSMGIGELGLWLGLIFGFGGVLGSLLGGYCTTRWFADNERGQMILNAVLVALLAPCFVLFLLVPQKYAALIALVPLACGFNFFVGPTFALLQRLVDERARATTLAVTMLLGNLIGMGIGPQIVGILSDTLAPSFGVNSLRYAMMALSLIAVWAAFHFWQVAKSVDADLLSPKMRIGVNTCVRIYAEPSYTKK